MGWVSPTSHTDHDGDWSYPERLYDGDTGSSGNVGILAGGNWSGYLDLELSSAITCGKVHIWLASTGATNFSQFEIDVERDSGWVNVYSGALSTLDEWWEHSFTEGSVTKARIRAYTVGEPDGSYAWYVREFAFEEIVIVAPTVTTQAVSSIGTTTATGNGTIEATGGEDASAWGTCLAVTENPDTGDTVDAGSGAGGEGAFTTSIDGLSSPAKYHVRAYATNSAGTSYGADVTFVTNALATALLGLKSTATRVRVANRSDTALLGLLSTASRVMGLTRADTGLLGLVASASRTLVLSRIETAPLGLKSTGSRVIAVIRADTSLLGLKTTASWCRSYIKTATALLGLKTTASRTVAYTRVKTALLGLKATASRVMSLSRADTALLGLKTTAWRIIAGRHYIRSATALLGLKATATRTVAFSRVKTALLGLKATATFTLSRMIKVITTQGNVYRLKLAQGSIYRLKSVMGRIYRIINREG